MAYVRQILELLYFASGIALACFGIYALKQFKVAKEQLIQTKRGLAISSKREAMKLTAEQCDKFAKDIIPLSRELKAKVEKSDIGFLLKSICTLEENSIKVNFHKDITDKDKLAEFAHDLSDLANTYEAFALYFEQGLGIDDVAYKCIGRVYCKSIQYLLPLMVAAHNEGDYNAALDLYFRWQNRINKDQLEIQQKNITKQIEKTAIHRIKTIGAE